MVLQGQDAWRRHPIFQNLWKQAWPGLNISLAVFGAYCVAEVAYFQFFVKPDHHHGHHHGHHVPVAVRDELSDVVAHRHVAQAQHGRE